MLPFLVRAVVLAVREHPHVNARYDDDAAVVTLDVPNVPLVDYPAPENHSAAECPLCRQGTPITAF